ncbi:hypothetical protein QLX67_02920, partial [Balneolaceae bacterium ANBcel3]|nr:hypothetical protein [Balneolaceae bacterium ANBcel3]
TSANTGTSQGMALRQNVRWHFHKRLLADTGWAAFETDDFLSRLYLYEHDVSHSMSTRMVYGWGHHAYVVLRSPLMRWMLLETKLSYLSYADRVFTGSGQSLTPGSRRWYYSFQIRFQY